MMNTQPIFAKVETLGAHLYVLADPLANRSLPGALTARQDHVVCLLNGGANVQAVSPHLVYIPPDNFTAARGWLDRHGPTSPCATLLASPLPLTQLAVHLKACMGISLPDGERVLLAYWDPAVLATAVGSSGDETLFVKGPVLSEAQRQTFLAPVLRWWYWDRGGTLRQIDWAQDWLPVSDAPLRPPFVMEQAQVDALVNASVPDGLLAYFRKHAPRLLSDVPEGERYGFVCRQINAAQQRGIEGTGAWMEYCALAVRYGEGFDATPDGAALLARLSAPADGPILLS
jgi:hypothetical protein